MMKRKSTLFILIILLLCLPLSSCTRNPSQSVSLDPDGLTVLFMDVGQADCALIVQGEHSLLVDTATKDRYQTIADNLDAFGISALDALILTHPHADHIGSAAELIENYPIGEVFLPNAVASTATFERTLDAIAEHDIPACAPEPGEIVTLGEAYITFLSPPPGESYGDLNDSSIAFIIDYDGVGMMFTGDMGSDMEEIILDTGMDISCELIKVPHHGSRTASCQEFVDAVNATYAIFTTTANSDDGLPKQEIIDRYEETGAALYFTHLDGAVLAEVSGGALTVTTGFSH